MVSGLNSDRYEFFCIQGYSLKDSPMRFNLFMNGFRKFGSASIIYKKSLK
ncbi:hypothetical protein VN0919_01320 [Helicobacter pylori]